ncbi:MAG: NUDIX hydrolase [Lachnospiraceae bacterium]|nr:NUDIX hydrolase [Lachnospiraceae bacterium]
MTEQEFLKTYNIEKYDRPSVATDIVTFSVMQDEVTNNRKLPEEKLKVLLIKRASHPCMNMWALPGGFCRKDEDIMATAKRELKEETGVDDAYLSVIGIEGDVDRDKRGWIISHSFMALINGKEYEVRGGTDAWEAKWFEVSLEKKEIFKKVNGNKARIENEYELKLIGEGEILCANILEIKDFSGFHEQISYEIKENTGIAFDHAKIMLKALLVLRNNVKDYGFMAFDMLPECFTLAQLQKVYEIIGGEKLTTPNFRRKMLPYLVDTKETYEDRWTRPAVLYKRNVEEFYK